MERVDGDLLILDKRNQKIHRLNETATAIWLSLQEGREQGTIVREIVDKFDISPELAKEDVTRVMQQFHALNLLAD